MGMSTDKAQNQIDVQCGDWSGTYPDPEGRTCDMCGSLLVVDCAGLVCDYCWRDELAQTEAEASGDGGEF
jgi:hypothetical protein